MDDDSVIEAMARLGASAPPDLVGRVLGALGLDVERGVWNSPIGPVVVAWSKAGIRGIDPAIEAASVPDAVPEQLRRRLDARMLGRRVELKVDLRGLSDFERDVLAKASEIPRGEVRPYGWIAREIGRPAAVRAVGSALGRNPVPLVIPCHRVVRTDGRIGDYAFGSPVKRALLTDEGVDPEGLERMAARGTRYVGSDTTHIFCHPTCRQARRITDAHRVVFRSDAAAAEDGYRPCKVCRPAAAAA